MLCFSVKMQCFPNKKKKKKVCSFVFIIFALLSVLLYLITFYLFSFFAFSFFYSDIFGF